LIRRFLNGGGATASEVARVPYDSPLVWPPIDVT
jgi:hypothetical protein